MCFLVFHIITRYYTNIYGSHVVRFQSIPAESHQKSVGMFM